MSVIQTTHYRIEVRWGTSKWYLEGAVWGYLEQAKEELMKLRISERNRDGPCKFRLVRVNTTTEVIG